MLLFGSLKFFINLSNNPATTSCLRACLVLAFMILLMPNLCVKAQYLISLMQMKRLGIPFFGIKACHVLLELGFYMYLLGATIFVKSSQMCVEESQIVIVGCLRQGTF